MAQTALEKRVAVLEQQVGDLLTQRAGTNGGKDWRRTRGVFTGDELMQQVFAAGQKLRRAERQPAPPRKRKRRPAAS